MAEVAVIIPTFNSIGYIETCLTSLCNQDCRGVEIIVVDNGSKDSTAAFVKKNYPGIIIIENKENLGACRAKNQGIEIAKSEWVLTLDCDVILRDDFLKEILDFAKMADSRVGVFQPKILSADKKAIYSCGIHLSWLKRFYDIGRGKIDKGRGTHPRYVFGACCAAALYKKSMLEDIKEDTGYFDERFFFLVEDVDVSWRAQRKGWKAMFYPGAVCYHYGDSSSLGKPLRQFFCWRNRRLLVSKCKQNKLTSTCSFLVYDLPRLAFLFLINPHVRSKIMRRR
jgi:GT2 family glycosyltransferase